MGLGARIYDGPIADAMEKREALQIPEGFPAKSFQDYNFCRISVKNTFFIYF
jgi:hypothetical protein